MGRLVVKFTAEELKQGVEIKVYKDDRQVTVELDRNVIEKLFKDDDTIPGHPNCKYGECEHCRVVSCGIYQGYESVPTKEHVDHIVLEVKVKE